MFFVLYERRLHETDKGANMKQTDDRYINPYKKFLCALTPNWVLRRSNEEISNGAKLCYARLFQYSGKKGQCFPKRTTLAKEIGCSLRTVSRYLKELISNKLIKSSRLGKRCSNRYRFLDHHWIKKEDYIKYKKMLDMSDMTHP